jgi:hypothetical protein
MGCIPKYNNDKTNCRINTTSEEEERREEKMLRLRQKVSVYWNKKRWRLMIHKTLQRIGIF